MATTLTLNQRARSVDAPPDTPLARLALLPAQVEIALAAGDVATARAAADELEARAVSYTSVAVRAAGARR